MDQEKQQLENGEFFGKKEVISNTYYHSLTNYFSSTQLKYLFDTSPKHFKAKYIDSSTEQTKQTPAMILGSMLHDKVLEPEAFNKNFFIMPKIDGRTKEGKARKEEALKHIGDRILTDDEQNEIANQMAESVLNNKTAQRLLENAKKEVAYFWRCPFSGLRFKAKLDAISDDYSIELKTAKSAKPDIFSKDAYNRNYDLSVVHYEQGLQCEEKKIKRYFIVVENTPPYVSQVFEMSEEFFESGHQKWLDAVEKLDQGMNQGIWPGYVNPEIEEYPVLYPPSWAIRQNYNESESDE